MLYIVYLVGAGACVVGIIRATMGVRAFLWAAREGRVMEGREVFNLALISGSGMFMVGVQILLLSYHRGWVSDQGTIPLWPGVAGVILLTISSAWALILRWRETTRTSMRQ